MMHPDILVDNSILCIARNEIFLKRKTRQFIYPVQVFIFMMIYKFDDAIVTIEFFRKPCRAGNC